MRIPYGPMQATPTSCRTKPMYIIGKPRSSPCADGRAVASSLCSLVCPL